MRYGISLLAAGLLIGTLAGPASAGPFSDVPTDHWAYDAIEQLQSEGIVEGYPDGTFKGNRAFTRYEMAMVVARLYTKIMAMPRSEGGLALDCEPCALIEALRAEFADDIADLNARMDALEGRVDGLEDRVGALERMRQAVQWSGMLRFRAEDIVTGENGAFNTAPGDPSTIPFQPGQDDDAGPEFEEKIMIALEAQPSDFIDVYVDLWQIASDLSSSKVDGFDSEGTGGFFGNSGAPSPSNHALIVDQAYATADLNKLFGYEDGLTGWLDQVYVTVGRQYNRFGAFGLTYDNGFETRPGIFMDAYGDRWEGQLMLARDVSPLTGTQDGLGAARIGYGFGNSHDEDSDRGYFAEVGVNYLFTGIGNEDGWSVDVDSELSGGQWFSGVKAEYYSSNQDQFGNDVNDAFGEDMDTSLIAGLDVFNNGNLMINARFASVGLPPGYSSVDNDPFEEYDFLANGIGVSGGSSNVNLGFESGLNYFPANFEGFGFTIQYTWFEKFFMDLTAYDGQLKSNDADLPAIIRLNARYPMSDNSDLGLEYIHAGIDATPALAKLRGEILVRF